MTPRSWSSSFPVLSRTLAKRLRLPLEGRRERTIEIAPYRMRGRKVLTVYAVHEIAELPDHLLYHLLLTSEAVERLRPTTWEIPLHGDTTTPDAYLIFPWGEAFLEVDTGHYSPEAVRTKLRTFRKPLYWATLSPERLNWVLRLSQGLHSDLRPLLLAPPE